MVHYENYYFEERMTSKHCKISGKLMKHQSFALQV